jgi:hypothetical protein
MNDGEADNQTHGGATIADDDGFRRAMARWVQLDVHIANQNQALRAVRDERAQLLPHLCRYIDHAKLHDARISTERDGTVSYATETTYPGFTQKFLAESLLAFFDGDAAKSAACVNFLKERRQPAHKPVLRRTGGDAV